MKENDADRTFCKKCGRLIRTGSTKYIPDLVKCSFLFLDVCNDCACDEDFVLERQMIKNHQGSRCVSEWDMIVKQIINKRVRL